MLKLLDNHDPFNYFPAAGGTIPVSTPSMRPVNGNIFQIDSLQNEYHKAKVWARSERLGKYYQKTEKIPFEMLLYIFKTLAKEYPDRFIFYGVGDGVMIFDEVGKGDGLLVTFDTITKDYSWEPKPDVFGLFPEDLLDAVSLLFSEDLVIYRDDGNGGRTTAIHLCHPNGWSAEGRIGASFRAIHEGVTKSNGSLVMLKPDKLAKRLVNLKEPMERISAISFRTDTRLNRHPDTEPGKPFNTEDPKLYMRFERQTITSFPELNSFLFTIKTYFVDCAAGDKERRQEVINAIGNYHPDIYGREFLNTNKQQILDWLKKGL